jgi:ABC-type phosphate/phosphonate transport system substrate-binding protein
VYALACRHSMWQARSNPHAPHVPPAPLPLQAEAAATERERRVGARAEELAGANAERAARLEALLQQERGVKVRGATPQLPQRPP